MGAELVLGMIRQLFIGTRLFMLANNSCRHYQPRYYLNIWVETNSTCDGCGVTMRNLYLDQLKGLAIIAVVFIHALEPAITSSGFSQLVAVLLRQPIDFAVAIFLALAGYFGRPKTGVNATRYILHRMLRVVPPYVFFTFIYLLLINPSFLVSVKAVIMSLATGTGMTIGYFVVVLCQYIVLTPLLVRLSDRAQFGLIVLGTIFGLTWTYYARLYGEGRWAEFPYYALPFFAWAPFYQLGLFMSVRSSPQTTTSVVVLLGGLALSVVEALYWLHFGLESLAASQIRFSSYLFSVGIFLTGFAFSNRHASASGALVWLGNRTYPIFLGHLLVLWPVQAILGATLSAVLIAGVTTLGVCVSMVWGVELALSKRSRKFLLGM